MSTPYDRALSAIDAAHAEDPTSVTINGTPTPYELHYAQKCTWYLNLLVPEGDSAATTTLRLAIRAQHFRRWEIPRSSYPATRTGYLLWRTGLKKRQAELVQNICLEAGFTAEEAERVAQLIRKEGLKEGEHEAQLLEDVACLVFLEERLEEFVGKHSDAERSERKPYGKERGREGGRATVRRGN